MTREQAKQVVLVPVYVWAGLMGLLLLTGTYAYWPDAPIKPVIGVSIGVAKALLIALFFMQLRKAAGLVRMAAITGVVWASFLFLLTFADVLTRP